MSVALDPRIAAKLQAFARRRRRLILLRGLCESVAALMGAMMVVAILDWVFVLPDAARWALSGAAYLAALIVLWVVCIRRMLHAPGPRRLARLMEGAEPSLREELLSAVELGQGTAMWDSEQFRALVQADVSNRMAGVEIDRLLPAVLLRPALLAVGIVLVLGAAALVLPSLHFGALLARAFAPGANLDRVSSVQVRIIQPTPSEMAVPQGDSVPLLVELTGRRVTKAYLETFTKSGGRDKIQLQPAPNGRFSAAIQVAREDVEYRIRAFDAITRKYRLQAAPRPRVVRFHKEYRYPEYTSMPVKKVDEETGDLAAVEGTEVEVTIDTDQPVKTAALLLETGQHLAEVPVTAGPDGKLKVTVPLKDSGTFRVDLVAAATGFQNKFSPEYEIRVSPDTIPQVTLEAPAKDLIASSNELIQLTGSASDDIGLKRVEQHVKVNDGRWSIRPVMETAARELKIDERWDLFQQGAKPGDILTTKLVAVDCKGNRGESRAVTVTVVAAGFERQRMEDLAAERALLKELTAWRASLEPLEKLLNEARRPLEASPDDMTKRKTAVAAFFAGLDEANAHTSAVQAQLTATLKSAAPGHESANLLLVAREVARATTMLNFAPLLFDGATLDSVPPFTRNLMGEAADAVSRVVQKARVSEEQHRRFLGMEELDVIGESLQVVSREQERLAALAQNTTDDANQWRAIAGRMKVVLAEVTSTEEQMKAAAADDGQTLQDRLNRTLKKMAEPHASATKAAGVVVPGRELLGPALNLARAMSESWRSALDLKHDLPHVPKNAMTTLYQEAGAVWESFEKMHQEVEAAQQKENYPDGVRTALAAGRWDVRAGLWKAYADAEEVRVDGDAPFVNDLRTLALALDGLREGAAALGNSASREETWKRTGVLDQAFRILEPAHELAQLAAGLELLSATERWQAGGLRARTSNVSEWMRWETRFRAIPGEISRPPLEDEEARKAVKAATDLLNTGMNDQAMRTLTEEMQQRNKTEREPVRMIAEADKLARLVRQALELLRTPIENARKSMAAAAPKLPERMTQLAKEAKELEQGSQEKAAQAEQKAPEQGQTDARQQMAKQQELNKKLDTLKDAIRSQANMQNVLDKEGREKARDADDALAMLKEPPVRAEQDLSEAAAAERASEQKEALEAAAKEENKLASALDQLAEHYDAMEKGDAEKSRMALRQAEQELGVKEQMDQAYAKADELAKTAQSSPEEMLQRLEKALPQNPLMRQELSGVSRDLLQNASQQLAMASSQESSVAKDVAKLAQAQAQQAAQAKAQAEQAQAQAAQAQAQAQNANAPQNANPNDPNAAKTAANPQPGQQNNSAQPQPNAVQQAQNAAQPNANNAANGQSKPQSAGEMQGPQAPDPALAGAAEKQNPIAKGAAEAGAAVERAGRHEQRLQNSAAGEQLQRLGAEVQETAQQQVPQAKDALNRAQAAADAQAPVNTADHSLQSENARLGQAQASPMGPDAAQAGQQPAGAKPDAQTAAANSPAEANAAAQAQASPAQDGSQSRAQAPGSKSPGAPAMAQNSPSPSAQQGQPASPANGSPTAGQPNGSPNAPPPSSPAGAQTAQSDPANGLPPEGMASSSPATPLQQVWMARTLDALDAALHNSPNAQSQQQGQQGQQGQQQTGQGKPGQQQGPPSDAMQQAQKALAAAGQAAAAEMRSGRVPTPGQPSKDLDNGDEVAVSKTGALANSEGKAHGILPSTLNEAVAKGAWGKLPKKLAEQLNQGQREAVAAEYQKEVETYYRAIAERARKENP